MNTPARVVVMLSGSGSNLQAILDATASRHFPAEVVGVISDKPQAYGLERARSAGIPARCVERRGFANSAEFERGLESAIDAFNPDFVALAGFMRILRGDLTRRFAGRMLNIHPSLLPKHKGLDTHQRALDDGDIEHGCTVHLVTPELDAGPAIIQATLSIGESTDADTLARRVLQLEHVIYPMALRWLAEGRLQTASERILLDGLPLDGPVVMPADTLLG